MKVHRTVERIKAKFPGLRHLVMFYNDGIVFQTDFSEEKDIPAIGENLSKLLDFARNVIQTEEENLKKYKKLIFETEEIILMIIQIGEESNLALFLANDPALDLRISPIREYLEKLEELIDLEKMKD